MFSQEDYLSTIHTFNVLLQKKWKRNLKDFTGFENIIKSLGNTRAQEWSYRTGNLTFQNLSIEVQEGQKPDILPQYKLLEVSIDLSVDIGGNSTTNGETVIDYLENLCVNIDISENYYDSEKDEIVILAKGTWHLDKSIPSQTSTFLHPEYHFHFGGHHLTKDVNITNFGQVLVLESPRIMHPPMDIILAIDFVIKHFYKKEDHEKLTKIETYIECIRRAREFFWKPYALAFASNFQPISNENIDSTFAQKILGN